jgi:glutamyl-Q tRNA(Asp) synthetase
MEMSRFAPSPTGFLHLGHAFSALTVAARAGENRFLLRIEDIDTLRCTLAFEAAIYEDLTWLGLTWHSQIMRQSMRGELYARALNHLNSLGVTYPCRCTRGDIRAAVSAPQDGAASNTAIYPGTCRARTLSVRTKRRNPVELGPRT